MKNIFYITLIISILGLLSCKEETITPITYSTITGQILSAETLSPLASVAVTTSPITSTILTDESGRFTFENIPTNTYTVLAEKNGYINELQTVNLVRDQTTDISLLMYERIEQNTAPELPFSPFPAHQATNIPVENVTLKWQVKDADEVDDLKVDVLLFDADMNSTFLLQNSRDTLFTLTDLEYSRVYYWQVIVTDGENVPTHGEVWSFMTEAAPDHGLLFVRETDGQHNLFCGNLAGEYLQITANGGYWRPRFSPDHTKIAYIDNNAIAPQISVMTSDGESQHIVTNDIPIASNNALDMDFCWSPNSSELLYMHYNKLYRIHESGSGITEIATAPEGYFFSECHWTIVQSQVVVRISNAMNSYQSSLHLLSLITGQLHTELVNDMPGALNGGMFSPDASKILYTYDVSEHEEPSGRQLDARIFILDITTMTTQDLSFQKIAGTNDLDARFSPNGGEIIFTNISNDGLQAPQIWKMNLQGEGRTLLFDEAFMPEW